MTAVTYLFIVQKKNKKKIKEKSKEILNSKNR